MGTAKKVAAESFKDVRRSGLIAIRLDKDDELQAVLAISKGDDVMLATTQGQSIRFKETDVREMGRGAGGVRAIKLGKGDFVIGVDKVLKGDNSSSILTLSSNGLGKKTNIKEYKTQGRGGSGIKTAKVTAKTGKLIVAKIVKDETEIIAVSQKGQVIRVSLDSLPTSGRQTQGVTVMKLRPGDSIASITFL
jgi:DNA gyrase subunit A